MMLKSLKGSGIGFWRVSEMELVLKNGFVYDPANNINGEKKDIFIKNGKIVESVNRNAKKIDCSGKIVMPGGVEIHSHIAGGKVNAGRILRPEDHFKHVQAKTGLRRGCTGYSTPSTFAVGYLYSQLGYTTAFTGAIPPLTARHTHEELHDIPMLDKSGLVLMGNNWFLLRYLRDKDYERAAVYVAWLLKATRGYAIKIVNPGGGEAWGWGKNVRSIDDPVPHFDITPGEIISGLMEVNELLNLPHSIHVHFNNLGRMGNYTTTIDSLELTRGKKSSHDRQVMQATHLQFHSYGGDSWKTFESRSDEIAKDVNRRDNIAMDTGNLIFGDTTTMTADAPMEYYLASLTKYKWMNRDIELETSPGITPMFYSKKSPISTVQWAVGLELALLIDDPWKVMITTDHPNGGPFINYPTVFAWLMSSKYREETMTGLNSAVEKKAILATIDRELDFNEIAIGTRAAQAKSLGLQETKGHLGAGADADIAVYDINPEVIDPSRDYKAIEKSFRMAAYTIKGGEILVRDGEIVNIVDGKTLYVNAEVGEDLKKDVMKDIEYNFKRFYSVNLNNYPVQELYLTNPTAINIETKLE